MTACLKRCLPSGRSTPCSASCEQGSSSVDQPRLFSHQRLAQTMQALVQLLIDRLDLNATNTAMLNRLSNGKRVVVIVLLATQVGFDMLCWQQRSEEHTSELQSRPHLVCRLLLEKKKQKCRAC